MTSSHLSSTSLASPPIKLAIDGYVLEGKAQGSRTVVERLLNAISGLQGIQTTVFTSGKISSAVGTHQVASGNRWSRLLVHIPRACHSTRQDACLYQYMTSPWGRFKKLVMMHDVLPITHGELFPPLFRYRCKILFPLSMRIADAVITVSETAKASIAKRYPWVASKLHVVLNGPSFSEDVYFKPLDGHPKRRPYILAVGRLERRKNIALLVRAFEEAALKDIDLVIVGKPDHKYSLDLSNRTNISHLTSVDDRTLIDLYRGASLFVFPSIAEGFGIPLLDAILFGCPTISSSLTAMPEIGGELAHYFNPLELNAPEHLANLIRGHFNGEPLKAPSEAERRSHARRFSWDASAHGLASLLQTLDHAPCTGASGSAA
jgi:glycosyltransferase involved in cell wall biosynthesis